MSSVEVLAGPYELLSKKNTSDRVTLCITQKNEVSLRNYVGSKMMLSDVRLYESFDEALKHLEEQITNYKKKNYTIKGEKEEPVQVVAQQPKRAQAPESPEKLKAQVEEDKKDS